MATTIRVMNSRALQNICKLESSLDLRLFGSVFDSVQKSKNHHQAANLRDDELLSKVESAVQQEDCFGVKKLVTLKDLFQARVHLGHNAGLRHESMTPFIFGTRQGVDIIDLEQTLPLLHHALNVCGHIVYRGGMVLFLSRNMQLLPWIEKAAQEIGEYAHCRPWQRGTFTNASNVFGTLPIYPDVCIFLGTQDTVFETHKGVIESSKLLIPSIGVVDTNVDCSLLTYCVPGNDDTPDAMHLYLELFTKVIQKAKAKRKEDGINSNQTFQLAH